MRERAWAHDNNPCPSCRGWGGHIVGRGTGSEDSQRCFDCRGTGVRHEDEREAAEHAHRGAACISAENYETPLIEWPHPFGNVPARKD